MTSTQKSDLRPPTSDRRPLVVVKYLGLQSGFGLRPSCALFNVVAGPADLLKSTVTVESLEADGYEVIEQGNRGTSNIQHPTSNIQPKEAA